MRFVLLVVPCITQPGFTERGEVEDVVRERARGEGLIGGRGKGINGRFHFN